MMKIHRHQSLLLSLLLLFFLLSSALPLPPSNPTSSSKTTTSSKASSKLPISTPSTPTLTLLRSAASPISTPPPQIRSRSSSISSTPSAAATSPPAGTFTARLKSWSHDGQTLTKLRFLRNALTGAEKESFERLLKEDEFYKIRVPANVLSPPGKEYVVSSVRARCIPRESLDEHFVIHMDGVSILAVNYGSAGSCQYPRLLKLPAKWSFNSYTVLKNSEQAPRTPTFAEELLQAETGEGEGVKPAEKTLWAKYWMYLIPPGMIVMNTVTQAMKIPDDQTEGQSGAQPQTAAQRAPNAAVRRR